MREKVVLAYSGGLDTSIIIPWLKENYNCDVIAMIADVGQGDDIDAVVEKAHKTGAAKVIVKDLRDFGARESVVDDDVDVVRHDLDRLLRRRLRCERAGGARADADECCDDEKGENAFHVKPSSGGQAPRLSAQAWAPVLHGTGT